MNFEDLCSDREFLFRTFLDKVSDLVFMKDVDSRFIASSRSVWQKYGMTAEEEIIGKTDYDLYEAEIADVTRQEELDIMQSAEAKSDYIEYHPPQDGQEEEWRLVSKSPLFSKQGDEVWGTFGIAKDITALKKAEKAVEEANQKIVDLSRQAGRAEVASGVLHNVGNVLNSVTVATSMLMEQLERSRVDKFAKVCDLLDEHTEDLGHYLVEDVRGKKIPAYLRELSVSFQEDVVGLQKDLTDVRSHVGHIKNIIAAQQNYAKKVNVDQETDLAVLVEDALTIHRASFAKHKITTQKRFDDVAMVSVDRDKVLQILVNLFSNAKHAMDAYPKGDHELTISLFQNNGYAFVQVKDSGIGMTTEVVNNLFVHGFTTRSNGHGFGLHSCMILVKEMGGNLIAMSDGPNQGSVFSLSFPLVRNG